MRIIIAFAFFFSHLVMGTSQDTTKVLFVGNSYTYFWNLPQVVEAMATSRNIPLIARQSTQGGVNLGHHFRGARNLKTDSITLSRDWTHVILQDHSLRAVDHKDSLQYYIERLQKKNSTLGIKTILYMTWARNYNPLMILKIGEGYKSVGSEIGIPVVPVGQIWDTALKLRPDLQLYDKDGSHPSPLGTYLTACSFFQYLTQTSPVGLPSRLMSRDKNGEKLYLIIVSPSDAAFCQEVVEQFIKENK